jgi:hypothetical protein
MNIIKLIFKTLLLFSLIGCCDCRDDDEWDYKFEIDFKSFEPKISIHKLLTTTDSIGNPTLYNIQGCIGDTNCYSIKLDWRLYKNKDTVLEFGTSVLSTQKLTIDIPIINLKHELTEFKVNGKYGITLCKCFRATHKTVLLDDSVRLDAYYKTIEFKK